MLGRRLGNFDADTDWANDNNESESIIGGYMTYHRIPVTWTSGKQQAVSLSSLLA